MLLDLLFTALFLTFELSVMTAESLAIILLAAWGELNAQTKATGSTYRSSGNSSRDMPCLWDGGKKSKMEVCEVCYAIRRFAEIGVPYMQRAKP